jgi:DNA-binding MarR family transcriptional regulator
MTKRTREVFPSGIGTSNLRTISSRLHYVQRLLDRQTKKYLSKAHNLTNAEWAILGYLAWHSPQPVADIAGETALFRSQVSRAITELERKQLVHRSPNQKDRRSPTFSISAEGLKVQRSIAKWAIRRERNFKHLLSDQQIETLNESLGVLAQYLKAEK